jgi:hypothetical protein
VPPPALPHTAQVLHSLIELDLFLPKHLIKTEGVLGTGGVSRHHVEVLFLSSLGLGPLCVKVGTDLGKGSLHNPRS